MILDTDQLLAVKAFQIGFASASPASRPIALGMVAAAIEQLGRRKDEENIIRLTFYHLARAEILRINGDPLPDRNAAQLLADSVGSDIYRIYMRIVERVRHLTHASYSSDYDRPTYKIGVDMEAPRIFYGYLSTESWLELWLKPFGASSKSITSSQSRFLTGVNLAHLLEKHGVMYQP